MIARILPILKVILALAIVGGVGWMFAGILRRPELWADPPRLALLPVLAAGGLYALALLCWGGYWLHLLHVLGAPAPPLLGLKAYGISQLGKYVPGKAWVLLLRVGYARAAGVPAPVAALAGVYETLAAMAAGALIAVVLLPWTGRGGHELGLAIVLLAVAGLPLVPGLFNRVAGRSAARFLPPDTPAPRVRFATLLRGLAQDSLGWLLLGASLLVLLDAFDLRPEGPLVAVWLRCTAYAAVAYVAGFLTLPAPGGLGVREAILQRLLVGEVYPGRTLEAVEGLTTVAVLVLRMVWTAVEVLMAGGLYFVRSSPTRNPERGTRNEEEAPNAD